MNGVRETERIETVVVGAGQAGLSAGYHLKKRRMPFVILDANARVGDNWRKRWDSLRLFTPAQYDRLAGLRFPGDQHRFPTKDEMGDYLESYAKHFELPVRTNTRVHRLSRQDGHFVVDTGDTRFEADNVVVAMGNYQAPKVPAFAGELDPGIVQLHSMEYRNPSQLRDGGVLIVGAGNSGSEIAMEFARQGRRVWMSGRSTGAVPFRIEGKFARYIGIPFVIKLLFHRVLTIRTPMGRKMRQKVLTQGGPLIRVKPNDLAKAGVERVPRTAGAQDGKPVLEDGRVLDVTNVIWCTGFHPNFSWIDLPVFGEREPLHKRGVVESEPGLYFTGLEFLYALSSNMVRAAPRDAEYVVKAIEARSRSRQPAPRISTNGTAPPEEAPLARRESTRS